MSIYSVLESTDNITLFFYIIIVLGLFYYFKDKNVGLNIILIVILSVGIISYISDANTFKHDAEIKEQEVKLQTIKPPPKNFEGKNDLIDFFFSIQDFYVYNPQAYEEAVDNVDSFLTIYEIMKTGTPNIEDYYQIADDKKRNACNAVQSLIFTVPNDNIVQDKLDRAHRRLDTILTTYTNELYGLCTADFIKKGFDINRKIINLGPKEYNAYPEKDFSYQFY